MPKTVDQNAAKRELSRAKWMLGNEPKLSEEGFAEWVASVRQIVGRNKDFDKAASFRLRSGGARSRLVALELCSEVLSDIVNN